MLEQNKVIEILLKEYDKIKTEQIRRIAFRDNLLYVMLGLFVTIASLSISNTANCNMLLIIPWACVVLGWTYIVNDEKISAIGRYIRCELVTQIEECVSNENLTTLLRWETIHRSDRHRRRRKVIQLLVDEVTFVVSGIVSLTMLIGAVQA